MTRIKGVKMSYIKRIIETELVMKMAASGAVLIKGPKSCGKTATAQQYAQSVLSLDRDPQVPVMMATNPQLLLEGKKPRLIDEWQEQPEIWNYVRHEVDFQQSKGLFILTGSANPPENVRLHSGAGRFTVIQMHTLSWQELGFSKGTVSLEALLTGAVNDFFEPAVSLEFILERICIGGWPTLINADIDTALNLNRGYIDLVCEVDMSQVSGVKRNPQKVRGILRSLSRNVSTLVDNKTLEKDIKLNEADEVSRNTLSDYLDALSKLMLLYEQPAFNPHIRSAASLRKTSKKHLCDTSLTVAALGLDKDALLNDIKYAGFLFESLAIHELNVYANSNDASVYHYNDSYGNEVDAIVQKRNGDYAAFEIKLGVGYIDDAVESLKKFEANIDTEKMRLPKSLNVITGTGMSYRRPDGINVISLAALGK